MGNPYLGELKLVSFNFPPKGWALSDGQILAINQYTALFSLFGTMYGGNGQTTFALPNLKGRVAIHFGSGYEQGSTGGETAHTLISQEMPKHIHGMFGVNAGENSKTPAGNMLANTTGSLAIYGAPVGLTPMLPADVSNTGNNQPHDNEQPYLTMNWIVAISGIFPSQN